MILVIAFCLDLISCQPVHAVEFPDANTCARAVQIVNRNAPVNMISWCM